VPDIMSIIKVKPSKIEYLDAALENKGLNVRHTLDLLSLSAYTKGKE